MYLYILSRPHSGSTLLDIMLGSGGSIVSCGELVQGMAEPEGLCACGAGRMRCGFWREVRARLAAQGLAWDEVAGASVAQTASMRRLPQLWRAPDGDAAASRLARETGALEAAITAAAGKPHLVDSSKGLSRALFLARRLPSFRLVHLVRDPRKVVESHHWRLKGEGKRFRFLGRDFHPGRMFPLVLPAVALGWLLGNLLGELIARHAPGRTVRLRYEDLRDRPAVAIERIATAFGIDLADILGRLDRGEAFPAQHQIAGNRIRSEGSVRLQAEARVREPMPRWVEWATVLICWPLMRRYGYPLASSGKGGRPAQAAGSPAPGRSQT